MSMSSTDKGLLEPLPIEPRRFTDEYEQNVQRKPHIASRSICANILSTEDRNTHVRFNPKPQRASQQIEAATVGFYFRRPIRPKFQHRRHGEL
jgi:hypothetical protein